MPSRLIDLDRNDGYRQPRLYVCTPEDAHRPNSCMAPSHCWGRPDGPGLPKPTFDTFGV